MTKEKMTREDNTQTQEKSQPDPALKRLEILVGKWKMSGHTLDSQEDNITGELSGEWILGGYFLQLSGSIRFQNFEVQSVEIIGYDPEKKIFPATVFGNMGGNPLLYEWDIQGNTVTHSAAEATYKGTISENGKTITGGWRPKAGVKTTDGNTYDMTMYRA